MSDYNNDLAIKEEYDEEPEYPHQMNNATQYQRALAIYKNEEYTLESDKILLRLSKDPKIPNTIREKQPVYKILVQVSKTLLLNEYEIMGLAAQIDSANWCFAKDLKLSEKLLKVSDLGKDVKFTKESALLFIYFLLMGHFVKEELNESDEVTMITAHCMEIYSAFKTDYAYWEKKYQPRLDLVKINKKYKSFKNSAYDDFDEVDSLKRNFEHAEISNKANTKNKNIIKTNELDHSEKLNKFGKECQGQETATSEPVDEEGPRTLPAGFTFGAFAKRDESLRGLESLFFSGRVPSREKQDRLAFFMPVNQDQLMQAQRTYTPDELFGDMSKKKVKKDLPEDEQRHEDSQLIEKKNSLMRLLSAFQHVPNMIDRDNSFLGEMAGIGRIISQGYP